MQVGDIIVRDLNNMESFTIVDMFADKLLVSRNTNSFYTKEETFVWEGEYKKIKDFEGPPENWEFESEEEKNFMLEFWLRFNKLI